MVAEVVKAAAIRRRIATLAAELLAQRRPDGFFEPEYARRSLARYGENPAQRGLFAASSGDGMAGFLCAELTGDIFNGGKIAIAPLLCIAADVASPEFDGALDGLAAQFCEWAKSRDAAAAHIILPPGATMRGATWRDATPSFRIYERRFLRQEDPIDEVRIIRTDGGDTAAAPPGTRIVAMKTAFPTIAAAVVAKDEDESSGENGDEDGGEDAPDSRPADAADFAAVKDIVKAARAADNLPFCDAAFGKWFAAANRRADMHCGVANGEDGEIGGVLGGFARRHPFCHGRLACAVFIRWRFAPPKQCRQIRGMLARGFFKWANRQNAADIRFILPPGGAQYWESFCEEHRLAYAGRGFRLYGGRRRGGEKEARIAPGDDESGEKIDKNRQI